MKKKFAALLALALVASVALTACGGGSAPAASTPAAGPTGTNGGTMPGTSQAVGDASINTNSDYTFRTSDSNRVVTENGTFTKDNVPGPVLVTSVGQSADVSMLDALMKKVGAADYTFNSTAAADEMANYGTIIIACGASSKGLGAAGISQEDELARAQAIVDAVKDSDATVIVAHLGGASRRGALSDQFNNMMLPCADYIMVVEDGNDDGLFTDAATDNGVPITLIYSIADAVTPLTELFGA